MRGISVIAAVCLAGAGCDGVFGIDHLDDPPDARPCIIVGHDEDMDGLDDGCDPCPFSAANDIDDDRDGIALACDPDPATPNHVLLFAGFGTGSHFDITYGTVVGDAVHTSIPAGGNTYILWDQGAVDDVYVEAGIDVHQIFTTATYREVGLLFDATPMAASPEQSGTYCVLDKTNAIESMKVYARAEGTVDATIDSQPAPLPIDTFSGTIRATFSRSHTPQVSCTFEQQGAQAGISGNRDPLPVAGKLGVYVDDAEIDLRYLFVVSKD